MPRTHSCLLLALMAAGVLTTACATRTINQLLADPARYRNEDVRLSGSVSDSYSIVNRGAYRLDDGTGQLWVVTERGTPRTGARVSVKGTVRDGFNLGTLGERIRLPAGVGSGLLLVESSRKAD